MSVPAGRQGRGVSTVVAAVVVVVIIVIAAAAYFLLAGSPGTTSTTTSGTVSSNGVPSTASQTGSASVSASTNSTLVNLAKAEGGSVTVYSIIDPTSMSTYIQPNFTKTYPWAKVNFVPLDPGSLVSRPVAEYQAGKVTADVIESFEPNINPVIAAGACAKVNMTAYLLSLGYPSSSFDHSGQWYPYLIFPGVVFYNTNLVQPSQAPKSIADLATAAWKGKVALGNPVTDGTAGLIFANLFATMGNSSWTQLMQQIASNQPGLESSGGDAYTLVSQGQYAVGIDTINDVQNGIVQKQPVAIDWNASNPLSSGVSSSCIATNAPHPNMALLYEQWYLSVEGQKSVDNAGFFSAIPAVNTAVQAGVIPSGVTLVVGSPKTDYYTNSDKWTGIYTQLFGSG